MSILLALSLWCPVWGPGEELRQWHPADVRRLYRIYT